jgi:ribosomal protein S18 acetylase RimI-like enzyme
MITTIARCSPATVESVVNFVYHDKAFLEQELPRCSVPHEVGEALTSAGNSWHVLVANQPSALFKLGVLKSTANISHLCPNGAESLDAILSTLRTDLHKMKIVNLNVTITQDRVEPFVANGFENRGALTRLSGPPVQMKMMPILPLMNPTKDEIPILSKLMSESYAKIEPQQSSVESKEEMLHSLMSDAEGEYLSDASFASGALPNLVSACLLTLRVPGEASIAQLFTHPLYRARGLATTEIAAAMNKLIELKVSVLTVSIQEGNEVAKRLFSKMRLKEQRRLVKMATTLQ